MSKSYLDMIFENWGVNIPDMKLEIEEMLGHQWIGVDGMRYKVESYGEKLNDGSRHATLTVFKHYDYCASRQQDNDGKTCTCLSDSERL